MPCHFETLLASLGRWRCNALARYKMQALAFILLKREPLFPLKNHPYPSGGKLKTFSPTNFLRREWGGGGHAEESGIPEETPPPSYLQLAKGLPRLRRGNCPTRHGSRSPLGNGALGLPSPVPLFSQRLFEISYFSPELGNGALGLPRPVPIILPATVRNRLLLFSLSPY